MDKITKNKTRRKVADLVKHESFESELPEGSLTRSLEDMLLNLTKMSTGELSPEESAEIALDLKRSLDKSIKTFGQAEARLIELEAEKSLQEAEAYQKALEAKMAEIAEAVVNKSIETLMPKIESLEKALTEASTRENEIALNFESIKDSLETLKAKPLFARNPKPDENLDANDAAKGADTGIDCSGCGRAESMCSCKKAGLCCNDCNKPMDDCNCMKSEDVGKAEAMLVGNKPKGRAGSDNNMVDAPKVKIEVEGDGVSPVDTNKADKASTDNNMVDAPKVKIEVEGDGISPVDTNKADTETNSADIEKTRARSYSSAKDAPVSENTGGIEATDAEDTKKSTLAENPKSLVKNEGSVETSEFISKSNWGAKEVNSDDALVSLLAKAFEEFKNQRR